MKKILFLTISMIGLTATAQNVMTPELLWQLGRVSPLGITKDGKNIIYNYIIRIYRINDILKKIILIIKIQS